MNTALPRLMEAKEVAEYLRLRGPWSWKTVIRWYKEGKLTGSRVGDYVRFTEADIRSFLSKEYKRSGRVRSS